MGNAFHGRGLTAKQADALGNVTACAYGGNLKSKTDADGYTTEYTYNYLDLVTFINYNDAKKVSYRHNATDDLIAMEDWLGETTFEVDLLHQLAVVMDLSGGWRGGRGCGYRQAPAESAADPREAANAAEDAAIAAAAAEAEKAEKGELYAYYHTDYLGTTDYLTSAVNSKVISWTSYNEWGEITHNAVLKCGQRELDRSTPPATTTLCWISITPKLGSTTPTTAPSRHRIRSSIQPV